MDMAAATGMIPIIDGIIAMTDKTIAMTDEMTVITAETTSGIPIETIDEIRLGTARNGIFQQIGPVPLEPLIEIARKAATEDSKRRLTCRLDFSSPSVSYRPATPGTPHGLYMTTGHI